MTAPSTSAVDARCVSPSGRWNVHHLRVIHRAFHAGVKAVGSATNQRAHWRLHGIIHLALLPVVVGVVEEAVIGAHACAFVDDGRGGKTRAQREMLRHHAEVGRPCRCAATTHVRAHLSVSSDVPSLWLKKASRICSLWMRAESRGRRQGPTPSRLWQWRHWRQNESHNGGNGGRMKATMAAGSGMAPVRTGSGGKQQQQQQQQQQRVCSLQARRPLHSQPILELVLGPRGEDVQLGVVHLDAGLAAVVVTPPEHRMLLQPLGDCVGLLDHDGQLEELALL